MGLAFGSSFRQKCGCERESHCRFVRKTIVAGSRWIWIGAQIIVCRWTSDYYQQTVIVKQYTRGYHSRFRLYAVYGSKKLTEIIVNYFKTLLSFITITAIHFICTMHSHSWLFELIKDILNFVGWLWHAGGTNVSLLTNLSFFSINYLFLKKLTQQCKEF